MELIELFIEKATQEGGFHKLKKKEADELEHLTRLAEKYEDEVLNIMPLPLTINSAVQAKMNEMHISQNKLAEMLGLRAPKLSQILNGKREPDIMFLKALHEKLGFDGNFILERV